MKKKASFLLLRSFFETDRLAIFLATVASIVGGACSALLVAFIGEQFTDFENFNLLSIVWFVCLLIISIVTNLYASRVLIDVSSQFSCSMRLSLCRRILRTDFAKLEAIGGHRLLAMSAEDMVSISAAFSSIPNMSINFTRVLFCVGYLWWLAPWAASILAILALPVVYVQLLLFKYSKQQMKLMLPTRDRRYALFESMVAGFKEMLTVRLWRNEFYKVHLVSNAEEFKLSQRRVLMANQYATQWGQNAYFLMIFALMLLSSSGNLDTEVVAVFALVGLFVRSAVNSLLQGIPIMIKASIAIEKINSLVLNGDEAALSFERVCQDPEQSIDQKITLQLSQLQFAYPEDEVQKKYTIGPIDLTLYSGELVFITGGNGSGKTTLIKILTALYKPVGGQLHLNGQVVSDENREWYQQHFYPLFSDFNLTDEFLQAVTSLKTKNHMSTLEKILPSVDGVRNTQISSPSNLSSGQRARLALYPMLKLDPPIVIFDEWAAHQDLKFKQFFYQELLPELKSAGKLVIVITHDDRYFSLADKLVKLDMGLVVD